MLLLVLKKLIFYNKSRKKDILLVGRGILTDLTALILDKLKIEYKYLKISDICKAESVNFFNEIYVPIFFAKEYDFLYKGVKDLRFVFYNGEKLFPVINNFDFFKECYNKIIDNDYQFDKDFSENLTLELKDIFTAIQYFYNLYGSVNFNLIEKYFFTPNIIFNKKEFANMLNEKIKNMNFQLIEKVNELTLKRKRVIINGTEYKFDIIVTDLKELIKPKKIVKLEVNLAEISINSDYTTEYFPENIVFNNNGYKIMKLLNNNKLRRFQIKSFENIDVDYFLNFFKNFFPELKKEDILVEKKEKVIYENFYFKNELQPFNIFFKILEIEQFFKNNFYQEAV